MRQLLKTIPLFLALAIGLGAPPAADAQDLHLPWRAAGLSEAEAAAHLLDRFAYGPRPGEVERVVAEGLEAWVSRQLDATTPEPRLDPILASFATLRLGAREAGELFPSVGRVLREAQDAGVITEADLAGLGEGRVDPAIRRRVIDYARRQGYQPARRLLGELTAQKVYRALYAESQLVEVLTDFWFNHFNVSLTDNEARVYLMAYERDAIRPHVLGSFRAMLGEVAKHPAMLFYLDNVRSMAEEGAPRTFDRERVLRQRRGRRAFLRQEMRRDAAFADNRPNGLNENYARELLELHTLGVDGGYTQDDVVAVARAFTGWMTYPPGRQPEIERRLERARGLPPAAGFVFEESFLFRADAHDAGPKRILGRRLPAGRGIEDGFEVLDLVAAHPSTARHLATKLATRFVADEPPPKLVERLAASFKRSGGDLRQALQTLVQSPEFWSPALSRRQKIKSPFELAISALRSLGSEVEDPREIIQWISRMGQELYAYKAPTGYPDHAEAWVNTGSLLTRMNFGLELATYGVSGVNIDLAALNAGREPESLDDALRTYVPLLLPERDPEPTIHRLVPVVGHPGLAPRLDQAARRHRPPPAAGDDWETILFGDEPGRRRAERRNVDPEMRALERVVGVILGSPEFQRR